MVRPTAEPAASNHRALGYANDGIIDVNDANFVTLTNLSLVGGEYGIWALGGSLSLTLSSISATAGAAGGIRIESEFHRRRAWITSPQTRIAATVSS